MGKRVAALLAAAAGAAAAPRAAGYTPLPTGTSWSLLAWGFSNGGKDSTNGVAMVDLDIDEEESRIRSLKDSGAIVICYFSTGTLEPFRSDTKQNADLWREAAVGQMQDWDEEWLDITKLDILDTLLRPRFERAAAKGCDGVEPDNVDCYDNSDCWSRIPSISSSSQAKAAQITFNKWQAQVAHENDLSIGLKNALAVVDDLVDHYDFAMNEQCQQYGECGDLRPFYQQNKAIFNVEYQITSSACSEASSNHMETKYCNGSPNNGICRDSWINCFEGGTNPPVPPVSAPTAGPPTPKPTRKPTTASPTPKPTAGNPTNEPTPKPTRQPTAPTTFEPTAAPTPRPTRPPTEPTVQPTPEPTATLPPSTITRRLPWNTTWSNVAWGWKNGGEDVTDGFEAVIVDLDAPEEYIRGLAEFHTVVCYFSVGTLEPKRTDVQRNLEAWQAASVARMEHWIEEWLNLDDLETIQALQAPRFARAAAKGCHGIEPDNVDCYDNAACYNALPVSNSVEASRAQQLKFNRWQIQEAHRHGLLIALKNSLSLVDEMHAEYDFAVNEQCLQYSECGDLRPFKDDDKAIFHVEYDAQASHCANAIAEGTSLKYCTGSTNNGICQSGDWINCFEQGPFVPTPPPTPQPTVSHVALPSFPAAWANLAFGFRALARQQNGDDAFYGQDETAGAQLIIVDLHEAPSRIKELREQGHTMICAFSAGAIEEWRPDYLPETWDPLAVTGFNTRQGYPWLNVGKLAQIQDVLTPRLDYAKEVGCHGILPGDLDCSESRRCRQNLGFDNVGNAASAEPYQLPLNIWIAKEANKRGLVVGQRNLDRLSVELEPFFDFAVVDDCIKDATCANFWPYMESAKPVLNAEYGDGGNACVASEQEGISTKLCEGRPNNCGSEWTDCFERVAVTPWPTSAPTGPPSGTFGGDNEDSAGTTSAVGTIAGVGVCAALVVLLAGLAIRRHRRMQADQVGELPTFQLGGAKKNRKNSSLVAATIPDDVSADGWARRPSQGPPGAAA